MAKEVIMPKNGMAMEEGTLVRWLKNVGDYVEKDDPLIEIETDKITMEEPAAESGYLLAMWAANGETVPALQVIGWLGERDEEPPVRDARESGVNSSGEETSPQAIPVSASLDFKSEVPATPWAKTLAKKEGISLETVPPTGKHGEITGGDVKKAALQAGRAAAENGSELSDIDRSAYKGKTAKRVPFTGMRKAIAHNMAAAHSQIPPVTLHLRADVTELFEMRQKINASRDEKLSVNDFIIKAVAKALCKHPSILASVDGYGLTLHDEINIGVAVSLHDGLVVPVIKNADAFGLEEIAATVRDLAARARTGSLHSGECSGSTFTITNLGMFGIEMFTPIINLPNAAILGVCAVVDELVLKDGAIVSLKKMGLSLTFDHRALDGATAAKFLQAIQTILEHPLEMLQ